MQIRKLSRRGRVFTAAGTVLGTLVGMVAVAPGKCSARSRLLA